MKKLLLSISCAIAMLFSFVAPVTVAKADTDFRYVNNTVKDTYRLDTGMIGYATVLVQDGDTIRTIKSGTVTVVPAVSYKKGNIEYNVYSTPVTVTVEALNEVDNALVSNKKGGCSSSLAVGGALGVAAIGIISVLLLILKRKGDRTNED